MKATDGSVKPTVKTGYTPEDVELLCCRSWRELRKRGLLRFLEEVTPVNYKNKIYSSQSVERLCRVLVKFVGLQAITGRRPVRRVVDAVYIPDTFADYCRNCRRPCAKMDVRRFCLYCGPGEIDWKEVFGIVKFGRKTLTFEV